MLIVFFLFESFNPTEATLHGSERWWLPGSHICFTSVHRKIGEEDLKVHVTFPSIFQL